MQAPSSNGAPVAVAGAGTGDLRLKLTWLTVFRTVATSLILLAILGRVFTRPEHQPLSQADSTAFIVIAGVYLLTLVYGLVLRRRQVGRGAAYLQVSGDVLLSSSIVYLTGGAESPFTFSYFIAIIGASIVLFQAGALVAAAASSLVFTTLSLGIHLRWIQTPSDDVASISTARLLFLVASNVLAQFLIAALASYLARELSTAGGRLVAREAEVRELVGLQNRIVAAMPSGLITCEADGRVTFINPAAATILGLNGHWRAPTDIESLIPGVLSLGPSTKRAERTVQTPEGQRTLGLTVTPLEDRTGVLLIVFQDLTGLRRMEDELRRVDRLASLGKLSAQLAHEIRNPLASMRGAAQMLGGEAPADSANARLTQILVREADRLTNLLEDFLRFARPPPPSLTDLPLDRLAAETVEMLRVDPVARGVELRTQLAPVAAKADADQLRQVLINLLRNGLVAAGEGGKVEVRVGRLGGEAQLEVWDSGGGIPPTELVRIFEPFYTTRAGGTGLGLSTAHSIVRAHGGTIQVTSSREQGTAFTVLLPLAPEA